MPAPLSPEERARLATAMPDEAADTQQTHQQPTQPKTMNTNNTPADQHTMNSDQQVTNSDRTFTYSYAFRADRLEDVDTLMRLIPPDSIVGEAECKRRWLPFVKARLTVRSLDPDAMRDLCKKVECGYVIAASIQLLEAAPNGNAPSAVGALPVEDAH